MTLTFDSYLQTAAAYLVCGMDCESGLRLILNGPVLICPKIKVAFSEECGEKRSDKILTTEKLLADIVCSTVHSLKKTEGSLVDNLAIAWLCSCIAGRM